MGYGTRIQSWRCVGSTSIPLIQYKPSTTHSHQRDTLSISPPTLLPPHILLVLFFRPFVSHPSIPACHHHHKPRPSSAFNSLSCSSVGGAIFPPLRRRDLGWLIMAFRRAVLKGVLFGVRGVAATVLGGGRHCLRSSSGAQR
jgi:hypothetical protein